MLTSREVTTVAKARATRVRLKVPVYVILPGIGAIHA